MNLDRHVIDSVGFSPLTIVRNGFHLAEIRYMHFTSFLRIYVSTVHRPKLRLRKGTEIFEA